MRLIDADFAKQRIDETMSSDYVYSTRSIKNLIDEAPTIEAEPIRHGRWIQAENKSICSECGYAPISKIFFRGEKIWEISLIEEYHWCPKCGAKQDIDDKEDE